MKNDGDTSGEDSRSLYSSEARYLLREERGDRVVQQNYGVKQEVEGMKESALSKNQMKKRLRREAYFKMREERTALRRQKKKQKQELRKEQAGDDGLIRRMRKSIDNEAATVKASFTSTNNSRAAYRKKGSKEANSNTVEIRRNHLMSAEVKYSCSLCITY